MKNSIQLKVLLGLISLLLSIHSYSATLFVTTNQLTGAGSLGDIINTATNGDIIRFDNSLNGIVINASSYSITKDLTIIGNGNGVTLIKSSGNYLFEVSSSHLSISELSAVDGGAYLFSSGGSHININKVNCERLKALSPIINCTTEFHGSDTLTMDSCLIVDCKAYGQTQGNEGSMIQLYNGDTLNSSIFCKITNCDFLRDTAVLSCFLYINGGYSWTGGVSVDVKNTTIKKSSGGRGTILYSTSNSNGYINFFNCVCFENELATAFDSDSFITCLEGGKLSFFECDFLNNFTPYQILMIEHSVNDCNIENM